ncbi:MAG: RNA polymerase sigma factor [bacterium]
MNEEEQALIKEAQRGNILAFESLVKRYDRQVLQLAYSMVNNVTDAQDIYQEVFIKVYQNLPRFRLKSKFSTWLYRIVVNACINYRKKHSRRRLQSLEAESTEAADSKREHVPCDQLNPEETVLNQELSSEINLALEQLSTQQKSVFILRHYHGHKLRDIAEIMHCSEGTIKNYLFRATRNLQMLLTEYAQQ